MKKTIRNISKTSALLSLIVILMLFAGCRLQTDLPTLPSKAVQSPTATLSVSPTPTPTKTPFVLNSLSPTIPKPTPTPTAVFGQLAGLVIGVDAGHQAKANYEQEPIGPGETSTRAKVSAGTAGKHSGKSEYEINLEVALLLEELLEKEGATVIMTRRTHEVDISNRERAELFNNHQVDMGIRLHCNGGAEHKKGAFMLVPAYGNYTAESRECAAMVLSRVLQHTGTGNYGITERKDLSGFNWCSRPIILLEMGHMTNREEDLNLASPDYQAKIAQGILEGLVEYFNDTLDIRG